MCTAFGMAISYYTTLDATWKTFAHEVGHNIGADHSFEEGQGATGGIMDYGDGFYNNVEQFNTKYRKEQVCSRLDDALQDRCSGLVVSHAVTCGDSLVEFESGEECECENGSTACKYCTDCKLDAGKDCSPDAFDPVCCTADGLYEPLGMKCDTDPFDGSADASDVGYCAKGDCVRTGSKQTKGATPTTRTGPRTG